ncbi:MAG: metal-dependent transcriptional regulator [Chloroflexi bacterium]|nr:metal-dependent transcriptional regulator [Chloroflexota bacterium]
MDETLLNDASPAMQRYAAEIFRLQQDHEQVRLNDLVAEANTSMQAVSRMVKRLKSGGYLEHTPYRGMRLTQTGERIAMPALRRHRLAEVFLVQRMGYDWAAAHELTETFERGLNPELEDRMDELTGHPTRCPHGEPIPTRDGRITTPDDRPLVEVGSKVWCRISRVRTHDLDKLRYIAELGLVPGADIYVMGCAPFQGPLRIQVPGGVDQIIGHELARALWVEHVHRDPPPKVGAAR